MTNLSHEGRSTSPYSGLWCLDPDICFLNHGSFGAVTQHVMEQQQRLRAEMERQPLLFLDRTLEPALDRARSSLASFVNCDADGLVFVHNATEGVNTVLKSLEFHPGDEIIFSDHGYNACNNAVLERCRQTGAVPVCVSLPFPVSEVGDLIQPWLDAVTPRTRLALVDHVTSPTALVLPISAIVTELRARHIEVLVDGAHAPGMLDVDIEALNPAWYTGNCHKWMCAPKGAAFLYVRRDLRHMLRPLVTSHGANSRRTDRSRLRLEFDWTGTQDPTAWLCIPDAIEWLGRQEPWQQIRRKNRALTLDARHLLSRFLQIPLPCPDSATGSMAAFPLPERRKPGPDSSMRIDPLQTWLYEEHLIEIPVIRREQKPQTLIRFSCQLYNSLNQYEHLALAIRRCLEQ